MHQVHTRMYRIQNKTDDSYVRFTSTEKVYNNLLLTINIINKYEQYENIQIIWNNKLFRQGIRKSSIKIKLKICIVADKYYGFPYGL